MRSAISLIMGVVLASSMTWAKMEAQTPDPDTGPAHADLDRPRLNPLAAEQSWGFLSDRTKRQDTFDTFKYIGRDNSPDTYLSLGLEYRAEYEYFGNWHFGDGVQDHNGYVLSRVMPHADLHVTRGLRLFTELKFDFTEGRSGGPRPGTDEDRGDVHQAFVEVGPHASTGSGLGLRVGRQEVVLGSGRLFDNNEGPNVKLSFDGLRLTRATKKTTLDIFALKPVEDDAGFFDDVPHHQESTWGAYFTFPAPITSLGKADLYFIELDTKTATYSRGSGKESRHTGGIRIFRAPARGADYNWEANYQIGSFGATSIRAWSVSTESGYTFATSRFRPRPLLRADVFSGDGDATGGKLRTFNPLFPRGAYFTPKVTPFVGPENMIDLHPVIQFQLSRSITGQMGWNWYLRQSVHDGVYAFGSGALLFPAGSSKDRSLGNQGDLEIRWSPFSHVVIAYNLAGFMPQGFLKTFPNTRTPVTGNVGITYRF